MFIYQYCPVPFVSIQGQRGCSILLLNVDRFILTFSKVEPTPSRGEDHHNRMAVFHTWQQAQLQSNQKSVLIFIWNHVKLQVCSSSPTDQTNSSVIGPIQSFRIERKNLLKYLWKECKYISERTPQTEHSLSIFKNSKFTLEYNACMRGMMSFSPLMHAHLQFPALVCCD